MVRAIQERVTVSPGGEIVIHHPEIPAGTIADIIVIVRESDGDPAPLASFAGKGKGCFANAAEIDAFIRTERNAWGR
jgi:hypothetical protein